MFTFTKAERLSSKKDIEALFKKSNSFILFPLKFSFRVNLFTENDFPARILISAPKRNFKHAVDRNLLKRRIREAYRLSKPTFYENLNSELLKIDVHINFIGKEIAEFKKIDQAVKCGLNKIILNLKKNK